MGGINVLSLFDGMSCGQIALEKSEIEVNKYYASEIDKYAIQVTRKNYPNTIFLGDVREIKCNELPKIDLLIGGSPCQNLSIAVINNDSCNTGLDGEKSKLFYEYVRILKRVKPKYFLLENVASMKIEDALIISEILGIEPYAINSNLVSAQDRERYYWTNIPFGNLPVDKGIVLKDIILSANEVDKKYWYDKDFTFNGEDKKIIATMNIKTHDLLKRVYNINGKCGTLTTCNGGYKQKKIYQNGRVRKLTPLEYERLQTVPDNYTYGVSDTQRYNLLGNGWTVDIISHIFRGLSNEV